MSLQFFNTAGFRKQTVGENLLRPGNNTDISSCAVSASGFRGANGDIQASARFFNAQSSNQVSALPSLAAAMVF